MQNLNKSVWGKFIALFAHKWGFIFYLYVFLQVRIWTYFSCKKGLGFVLLLANTQNFNKLCDNLFCNINLSNPTCKVDYHWNLWLCRGGRWGQGTWLYLRSGFKPAKSPCFADARTHKDKWEQENLGVVWEVLDLMTHFLKHESVEDSRFAATNLTNFEF